MLIIILKITLRILYFITNMHANNNKKKVMIMIKIINKKKMKKDK